MSLAGDTGQTYSPPTPSLSLAILPNSTMEATPWQVENQKIPSLHLDKCEKPLHLKFQKTESRGLS